MVEMGRAFLFLKTWKGKELIEQDWDAFSQAVLLEGQAEGLSKGTKVLFFLVQTPRAATGKMRNDVMNSTVSRGSEQSWVTNTEMTFFYQRMLWSLVRQRSCCSEMSMYFFIFSFIFMCHCFMHKAHVKWKFWLHSCLGKTHSEIFTSLS